MKLTKNQLRRMIKEEMQHAGHVNEIGMPSWEDVKSAAVSAVKLTPIGMAVDTASDALGASISTWETLSEDDKSAALSAFNASIAMGNPPAAAAAYAAGLFR
jgi:hypothetical protein